MYIKVVQQQHVKLFTPKGFAASLILVVPQNSFLLHQILAIFVYIMDNLHQINLIYCSLKQNVMFKIILLNYLIHFKNTYSCRSFHIYKQGSRNMFSLACHTASGQYTFKVMLVRKYYCFLCYSYAQADILSLKSLYLVSF